MDDIEPGMKYELQEVPVHASGATGLTLLTSVRSAGKYHQNSAVAVKLKFAVSMIEVFSGARPDCSME